jgi:outer membrane protein
LKSGECATSDTISEISMHRNIDCANDLRRSTTNPMNRILALASALTLGFTTTLAIAQAPAAAAPAPVAPQAVPAKIALIQFEQAAAATNEGQRSLQELQKKYEPKKAQLEALGQEIDTLTKQLQAAPATMPDAERASRQRTIETKQKQYQRDGEDAQNAYGADLQEAVGKVAQKLGPVVINYVQKNGYTMLLDNTGQQGGVAVLWTQDGTDISQAIVDAYNASSGVAAPVPSAPSATPRPRTTAPATAPKPAAK